MYDFAFRLEEELGEAFEALGVLINEGVEFDLLLGLLGVLSEVAFVEVGDGGTREDDGHAFILQVLLLRLPYHHFLLCAERSHGLASASESDELVS